MRAIQLMFDSLNRRLLEPYGSLETQTPNFKRLAERCVTFDRFYVGSMPCIPARRELHTGRPNFLHRSWGPLEPFDDSAPEILKQNGVYTHLVTDHKHYWRDGGATYHNRYSTYEFIRGQAGDLWIPQVDKPLPKVKVMDDPGRVQRRQTSRAQDLVNRHYLESHQTHQLVQTFDLGLDFIQRNKHADRWFLQIECFDPHEPYFVQEAYRRQFHLNDEFDGWAPLIIRSEEDGDPQTIRDHYKALLAMVDDQVGRLLDVMDHENLWNDTMLIVNTDHGCFLGEHDWWYMGVMPLYNEMANIPFFLHDPRHPKQHHRSSALAQNIDVPATLLDFFGIQKPKDMMGESLLHCVQGDPHHRDLAFFGYFGGDLNVTDGNYVYMRAPMTKSYAHVFEYTLMPTHINQRFSASELTATKLHPPFRFTKDCPVLKIPATDDTQPNAHRFGHRLFNLKQDPSQLHPIDDPIKEAQLCREMEAFLRKVDAPIELHARFGLDRIHTAQDVLTSRTLHAHAVREVTERITCADRSELEAFLVIYHAVEVSQRESLLNQVEPLELTPAIVNDLVTQWIDPNRQAGIRYQMDLMRRIR
jgi:arylsulfatase A-like enzyme